MNAARDLSRQVGGLLVHMMGRAGLDYADLAQATELPEDEIRRLFDDLLFGDGANTPIGRVGLIAWACKFEIQFAARPRSDHDGPD